MVDEKSGGLTEQERRALLESYGLDENKLKEYRDIVLEWCSKEEHLKDAVPYLAKTAFVDRQLLMANGSVEEAKTRVDNLLRIRSVMPEMCLNRELSQFDQIHKYAKIVLMPKVMPNTLERILIFQYKPVDDFDITWLHKLPLYLMEHNCYNDISIATRYIVDLRNVKLSYLAKYTPYIQKKMNTFWQAHGLRCKGIHLLNAPSFIDKLMLVVKQFLKPKLVERIRVHPTIEDLHKHVPKEVLPSDYKGDEPSSDELYEKWRGVMESEEAKQKMAILDKLVSDESKRLNTNFDEEQLGMPGSFKKLDLD